MTKEYIIYGLAVFKTIINFNKDKISIKNNKVVEYILTKL